VLDLKKKFTKERAAQNGVYGVHTQI